MTTKAIIETSQAENRVNLAKIHSLLVSLDTDNTGKVDREIFAKIVDANSNKITKDELTRIINFIAGQ